MCFFISYHFQQLNLLRQCFDMDVACTFGTATTYSFQLLLDQYKISSQDKVVDTKVELWFWPGTKLYISGLHFTRSSVWSHQARDVHNYKWIST